MRVVVFGSTGHVGRLVVQQLLAANHIVVAFVHGRNMYQDVPGITVVQGDVHQAADVTRALQGADAVISTLGSWHTPTKDILSTAMQAIIPVMEAQGPKRIITLTGADARSSADVPTLAQKLLRPVFTVIAGKILADGEEHMKLLQASTLDWTVVRSPVMRGIGGSGNARLDATPPLPWATVHRQDVAEAIVSQLQSTDHLYKAPFIHSK